MPRHLLPPLLPQPTLLPLQPTLLPLQPILRRLLQCPPFAKNISSARKLVSPRPVLAAR